MRSTRRWVLSWGLAAVTCCALSACAAKAPVKPAARVADTYQETRVPTVPPAPATPLPAASALPTRPLPKRAKARKGETIGPIITFFGGARADGTTVDPISTDKHGVPIYRSSVGSGFMLVVEAKPGKSGLEAARSVFMNAPGDPTAQPDLEIEANRDLGNGSAAVCDKMKPNIGGIPGIEPPSFAETQRVTDALNDFACRFETFIESDSSCTMNKNGDYSFVNPQSTTQFCMIVARAWAFPPGETLVSVRVRDSAGNPGPTQRLRIVRPAEPAKPAKKKG